MDDSFFTTRPLPTHNGYTWTLPSRLGQMLIEIEGLFGERDRSWTILGIEFTSGAVPQHWFPGNNKSIVIQLTTGVENSPVGACWELAHEAVHMLSPTGGIDASVLEEGMAVYYAKQYVRTNFGFDHPIEPVSYQEAYSLVRPIVEKYPGVIKEVRKEESTISKINKALLLRHVPGMSEQVAQALSTQFIR